MANNSVTVDIKARADQASFREVRQAFENTLKGLSINKSKALDDKNSKAVDKLNKEIQLVKKLQQAYESAYNHNYNTVNATQLKKNLADLKIQDNQLRTIARSFSSLGAEGSKAFKVISASVMSSNTQLQKTQTIFQDMMKTMGNTIKWGISSSIMNSFTGAVSEAYSYVKNLDKSLNNIRIVGNKSANEMERFAKEANKAAQALGATTLDYTDASLIYYQQGLSDKQVKQMTDITIKMSNVLGASAEEVSDYMTAIWNNFYETGGKSLEYYADVLAKLGAATASSAEEISTGLEKFAAIADTVGLSYEYATAALTTVTAKTRQSAEVVGTAFKTLFARIQDLELGKTLDDGVTLGKYSEALAKVGINILDANGQLKDMDEILNAMGSKWETLSDAQKVSLAQTVAGVRQYNQLMALMDNWSDFTVNLNTARTATGALEEQQAIYMESTEAHLNAAAASWEDFKDSLLDTSVINFFADLSKILGGISTHLVDSFGGGLPIFGLLGGSLLKNFSADIGKTLFTNRQNFANSRRGAAERQAQKDEHDTRQMFKDANLKMHDGYDSKFLKEIQDHISVLNKNSKYMDEEQEAYYKSLIQEKMVQQAIVDEHRKKIKLVEEYAKLTHDIPERDIVNLLNEKDITAQQDALSAIEAQAEQLSVNLDNIKIGIQEIGSIEAKIPYIMNLDGGREPLDSSPMNKKTFEETYSSLLNPSTILKDEWQALVDSGDLITNTEAFSEIPGIMENIDKLESEIESMLKSSKKAFDPQILLDYEQELQKLPKLMGKATDQVQEQVEDIKKDLKNINPKEALYAKEDVDKINKSLETTDEDLKQISKYDAFVSISGGALQATTGINGLINAFSILQNDSLSTGEKIMQIFTGLLMSATALTSGVREIGRSLTVLTPENIDLTSWDKIKESVINLAMAKKEVGKASKEAAVGEAMLSTAQEVSAKASTKAVAGEVAVTAGNAAVGTSAAAATPPTMTFGAALLSIAWPALAVVGALAAVGAAIYLIHRAVTKEERELKESLKRAEENVKKTKEEYDELNSTITDYKGAVDAIHELEHGTVEFYTAIMEANEKAMELIDTLGLIAGEDFAITSDGLISINEEAMKEALQEQQRKVFQSQGSLYTAKYNMAEYERKQTVSDFRHTVNRKSPFGIGIDQDIAEDILSKRMNFTQVDENTYQAKADLSGWNDVSTAFNDTEKKLTETGAIFSALVNPLGTLAASVGTEMVDQGFKDGTTDITNEVAQFRDDYNVKTAEMLALEMAMADSFIRAYADEDTLKVYNEATKEQKKQMQIYTNRERAKAKVENKNDVKGNYGSFWDTSDSGFWGKAGVELLNILTMGELGSTNRYYNKDKLSDLEIKEMYAKNVLGYTQDEDGKWKDETGKRIKQKQIRKIDLEIARDAYLSGEYSTAESSKSVASLLETSKKSAQKSGLGSDSQDYVAEAFLAYVNADNSFDFNKLTDEERDEAKKQVAEYAKTQTVWDVAGKHTMTAAKLATSEYSEIERTAEDNTRFNDTIEQEAGALGTTTAALKLYALAQQNATDSTKKLTAETAKSAAESYKFNKAYNQGRKTFTDNKDAFNKYIKALKNGEEVSYDVADGAGAIITSLEEMGLKLTNEQLKDPKILKDVKKLFTGTEKEAEEAFKRIQNATWVEGLTSQFGMAKKDAQDFVDYLNGLEPGADINFDKLSQSLAGTEKTLEDWQAWAKDYGIEVEVSADYEAPEPKNLEYQPASSTTKHVISGYTKSNGETVDGYEYYETIYPAKQELIGFGDLKLKKVKQGGGGNFKPSTTGNTGGGSKNKKKVEKDKDLYEKVNVELARTGKILDRLDKQAGHLVGQDYINNAIQQIQTLNKEIDLTKEKISIMEKERDRLRKTLTKTFGAKFDEDGVLQNYDAIYEREFAKYKKIQEGNYSDEKKEKSEERWQKFLETYQRYDEIVGTDLPELENDVLEKIYQIIEKQIDKFEYTIKINLDLSEAKREWAEFRKKYILGLEEDEDFAKIAQVDFGKLGSFFNDKGKGELQVLFNELSTINGEIEKMNNGELSSIFSAEGINDMNAAIEKQKEVLEKIMSSYGNFDEILDAINESYRNMLDAAEADFGEHIEDLENINSLLEHNKNVLNMIFGDQGYKQLSEVLKLQNANNKQTLDDLRAQRDYYKTEMAKEEEGSDNWNALAEKYASITAQIESQFETYMQGLIDTLINDVNASFQKVNEELLGEDISLNYAQTEWDMINRNADQYLDTVNAIYSTQKLQNKYLDAIDKTESVTQQKKLNDLMDKELKALREKDKLSQYDLDRANLKYEIALKQIALEEAQQNKSQLRLRRDSQGNYTYQYTADSEKVASAEQELSDLYNQLYNLDKDEYKNNLDQLYAAYAEFQQKMAEAKNIADEEEQKKYEEMIKAQYQALTDTLTAKNEEIQSNLQESTTSSLLDSYEQNTENYEMMTEAQKDILEQYIDTEAEMQGAAFDNLFGLYNKNLENFNNMTSAEINTLMTSFVPQWNSTYQQLATSIIGKGGFAEVYKNAFAEIDALTKQFFETRATEWEKWKKDQEEAYSALTGIVESNDKIIQRYTEEAAAIREVVAELEVYLEKYGDAIEAVKQLITLTQQLREETDDTLTNVNQDGTDTGSEDTDGGNNDNNNNNNNTDTKPSLTKGSAVKLKAGTKWYGDSYGGGGSGSTSKQKSVTITRVNENGSHPYHVNKLGWVRKKDIVGYDTGGYTGNWANSDGRLAMLHKKELVLNAHDTQNMLDAVTILRDLTSNLGATLLGRMASISANGIGAFGDTGAAAGLEQMVTINAEFPNVTNSHEIEDAINNLVNRASQYIHKN